MQVVLWGVLLVLVIVFPLGVIWLTESDIPDTLPRVP